MNSVRPFQTKLVGVDQISRHPKPCPTNPRNFFDISLLLYRKGMNTNHDSVPEFLKSQNNLPIITDSDYQILPDISKKLIDKKVIQGQKIKLSFDLTHQIIIS